jgi:hypothetical protein
LLSDEELAAGVDGEDSVEFFWCGFGNVPEGLDARVRDYDVDVFEMSEGSVEELNDVGGLRDICCNCDSFVAGSFDGFDDLRRSLSALPLEE